MGCSQPRSSTSSRTTIRWPTPATARACMRDAAPGRYRAMTALLLLMPGTPMLFQGQEFGASAPFLYFADHEPELAAAVRTGPRRVPRAVSEPGQCRRCRRVCRCRTTRPTFERCKLDWREQRAHDRHRRLHADLLALRRTRPRSAARRAARLTARCWQRRRSCCASSRRTRRTSACWSSTSGRTWSLAAFAEPLLAPPDEHVWALAWSSEDPDYGGSGTADVVWQEGWRIPGQSATVLATGEGTMAVMTGE